jgi:chromosomal replication initiation ATPase DnaA
LYRLVVDKGWSKSARAREIIRICADKNGLTVDTILSPQRTQKVAEARQQAMWLVARETSMSLAEIGRIFDRDHTTVIYAIQRENERTGENVRSDQKLVRKMARAGL